MSPAVSPGWTAGVQSQFLTKSNVEQSMDDDQGRASFMASFRNSNGAPQVVILCLLIALSLGSTIGVVPAVMTDRFARLNYGFDDEHDCSFFTPEKGSVPKECTSGSNDAQNAMAMSQLVMNLITFLTSSVVGSMSDVRGRRSLLLAAIFLSLGGPFLLVVLQLLPHMSPYWYYAAVAGGGIINFLAIALSVLGDVMPVKFRAPCFGLLLAGFSLGFALSPMIAMTMSPLHVSVASFFLLLMGFLFVLIKMPETLTEDAAADAAAREQQNSTGGIKSLIFRPVSELSILNRDQLFRTLGALAFFSGLAANGDQSLLIYYVESHLGFQAADVAKLFIILGLSGIFVNSIVLKLLTNLMGERLVIVLSFAVGVIHNIFYGIATSKGMVYGACCLGTITMLSFPVISAIKSNNVKASEQGRIQGALYSVKSLSAALGPVTLRYVSENSGFLGPGFMFIFCSFLYLIATVWAFLLPKDRSNSSAKFGGGVVEGKDPKQAPHLQEPLMGA